MRIGLIDVDGHNFPNLPLMKLSAWHKQQGDTVEWYEPLFHSLGEPFDKVYMSKVFSDEYMPDYPYFINSKEVIRGGVAIASDLLMGKKCLTKASILIYQKRLSTYIQIIQSIMTRYQRLEILLMDFLLEVANVTVISVMWHRKREDVL